MNNHKINCQMSATGWAASVPPVCTCTPIESPEEKCNCPTKYCKHFESDFDKYCKEHPHCDACEKAMKGVECKENCLYESVGVHSFACPKRKEPTEEKSDTQKCGCSSLLAKHIHVPEEMLAYSKSNIPPFGSLEGAECKGTGEDEWEKQFEDLLEGFNINHREPEPNEVILESAVKSFIRSLIAQKEATERNETVEVCINRLAIAFQHDRDSSKLAIETLLALKTN